MVGPLILAIDEGTTNAKAIAVDRDGRVVARGSQSLTLQHPQPGLAEPRLAASSALSTRATATTRRRRLAWGVTVR